MSIRSHRPTIQLATFAAGLLLAGTTQAQVAGQGAPRYMSWAGRPATTTPASTTAAIEAQAPAPRAVIPRRVAPSRAAARPMMQPVSNPAPPSRGLTPASAWLGPQPVSSFAPGSPDPLAYTRDMVAPAPAPAAQPVRAAQPPAVRPQPAAEALPSPVIRPETPVASASLPVEPAAQPQGADPMAPRPDALIFRLRPAVPTAVPQAAADQTGTPAYAAVAAPTAATAPLGQQGSRYYSVHRENGHAPDRTPLPEAVFYDSVALDLAEPPETQLPQRDLQGRLRPPVRDEDPERP